jgi:L-iditol 2-dehydrogenase
MAVSESDQGPPATARAAVLIEPGRYELREYALPAPERGGAIVRIELSGICGTDKHTYQGVLDQYGGTRAPRRLRLPLIQGHENVGTVAALGGDLTDFEGHPLRIGDRVVVAPNISCGRCYACRHGLPYALCEETLDYGNTLSAADPPHLTGGWAEYMVVLPGSHLFRVPEGLPSPVAVLAELMAVTVGLDRARQGSGFPGEGFRFDDTVVVYGAGPLGLCHVMKARMLGAGTIVAIDRSAVRLSAAQALGADVAVDVDRTDARECLELILRLTGGRGADLVVESAGMPDAVPAAIELLRPGGTLIEAGNFSDLGEVAISPHRHLVSKGIRLIGVPGDEPGAYLPAMRQLVRYRERYPVDRLVAEHYPLDGVREAMERSLDLASLKVVIDPWAATPATAGADGEAARRDES